MSTLYSLPARLSPSGFGRLRQLLDGDETQGKRTPRLARDPDRLINQPTRRSFAQHGEQIDRLAVGAKPTRILPTCPHHDIGASVEELAHAVGLQIGAIADADFAFDDRYAVEPFTALFVRQFEKAEAFARQVESTVNTPQLVLPPGESSGLRHGGRVDETDQPALSRLGRIKGQRMTNQQGEPISTLTEAIKQRDVGNVGEPDRIGPCGRAS